MAVVLRQSRGVALHNAAGLRLLLLLLENKMAHIDSSPGIPP